MQLPAIYIGAPGADPGSPSACSRGKDTANTPIYYPGWRSDVRNAFKAVCALVVLGLTVLIWLYGFGYLCPITDAEHYDKGTLSLLSWRLFECRSAGALYFLGIVLLTIVINVEVLVFHYAVHALMRDRCRITLPVIDVCAFAASLGWTTLTFHTLVDKDMNDAPAKAVLIYPWMRVFSIHNYGTILMLVSLLVLNITIYSVVFYSGSDGTYKPLVRWDGIAHAAFIFVYVLALFTFYLAWNNPDLEMACIVAEFVATTALQGMVAVVLFVLIDMPPAQVVVRRHALDRVGDALLVLAVCVLLAGAPADECVHA